MSRAYTAKEVSDLRRICRAKVLFGSYGAIGSRVVPNVTRADSPEEIVAIESLIQTNMIAELTAEDILKELDK